MTNNSAGQTLIRVYGVCIKEQKLLLLQESMNGKSFTKFPGGGLEYGEGLKDCLKREFLEELGWAVEVYELVYVNDFCQPSAFHQDTQIISFYYRVVILEELDAATVRDKNETPTWVNLNQLTSQSVDFPIDKTVVEKLMKEMKLNG